MTKILVSLMIAVILPCLMAEEAPLLETAMEVVARATSSSSVISLNLTGVIILVVLKIALIAFSFLNFGGAGQQLFGARSLYSPPGYSSSDLTGAMCFLLYTSGDDNKMECIKRASCESPSVVGDYLRAAKAWHKLHLLVDSVPYTEKYTSLIEALEQANEVGAQEGDCSMYSW